MTALRGASLRIVRISVMPHSRSTDEIIFALGTPVICHDKNSDIAGDFGDRIYCEETDIYTIRI